MTCSLPSHTTPRGWTPPGMTLPPDGEAKALTGPVARNRACITRPGEALEQMTEDLMRLFWQNPGSIITEADLLGLGWTRAQVNHHGERARTRAAPVIKAEQKDFDPSSQGVLPAPEASRAACAEGGTAAAPESPAGSASFQCLAIREMLARNDEAFTRLETLRATLREEVQAMKARNTIIRDFIKQIEAVHG